MGIRISNAVESDIPKIIDLIREFTEYENLAEFCQVTADSLFDVMFGPGAFVEGLVAFDNAAAVGYALFYPCFATFRGQRGVWLEDIYIKAEYRRHNLGEKMLREVARAGKKWGARRIDFLVLDWNTPAIGFYEKHGAVNEAEARYFKFTDDAFQKLNSE